MSGRAGARTGLLPFELACVMIVLTLGISRAATQPYHGKTMLVGIVLPEGCLPKHPCTASLVANPDEITGTRGVVVRKVRVPEHKDSHGHATLEGEVISSAHGEHQQAGGPTTFVVPETGASTVLSLEVALANEPDETVPVPIRELPPPHENTPAKQPAMAPLVPDNGVCVVHDEFTGDGRATRIKVNGADVPALAESPSVLAFAPEDALQTGQNRIVVVDGGTTKTYEAWAPDLTIDSNKTTLEQNESTQFRVKLDLGRMPDSYWGKSGAILLTIKNDSDATASMSGGDEITVPLHRSDTIDGTYTYQGTITAKEPGQFEIQAAIQSELADAPPVSVSETPPNQYAANSGETPPYTSEGIPVANPTPTPGHTTEKVPTATPTATSTPCKDASFIDDSNDQDLKVKVEKVPCKCHATVLWYVIPNTKWSTDGGKAAKEQRDQAQAWFEKYCIELTFREFKLDEDLEKRLIKKMTTQPINLAKYDSLKTLIAKYNATVASIPYGQAPPKGPNGEPGEVVLKEAETEIEEIYRHIVNLEDFANWTPGQKFPPTADDLKKRQKTTGAPAPSNTFTVLFLDEWYNNNGEGNASGEGLHPYRVSANSREQNLIGITRYEVDPLSPNMLTHELTHALRYPNLSYHNDNKKCHEEFVTANQIRNPAHRDWWDHYPAGTHGDKDPNRAMTHVTRTDGFVGEFDLNDDRVLTVTEYLYINDAGYVKCDAP